MKRLKVKVFMGMWLMLSITYTAWCQIEESAEVFLEAYTDQFQEYFFEGLKQRGIENYDRAVEAFLKCKDIDPSSHVIDHEIAKSYLLDNKVFKADQFAREALLAEPENRWYLDTYVQVALKQGYDLDRFKTALPYENDELKANLAHVLFNLNRFEESLKVIQDIPANSSIALLKNKVMDSVNASAKGEREKEKKKNETTENPLEALRIKLRGLADEEKFTALKREAENGTELYPAQPDFHYFLGKAKRGLKDFEGAIRSLETALDFTLEEGETRNEIYRELAATYNEMGNSSKANMYLSKIKSGL